MDNCWWHCKAKLIQYHRSPSEDDGGSGVYWGVRPIEHNSTVTSAGTVSISSVSQGRQSRSAAAEHPALTYGTNKEQTSRPSTESEKPN